MKTAVAVKMEHIEYHEPDGLVGFVKDLNKSQETLHEVVYFQGESEGITVEVAFQYVNEFHENVLGFCNNIYNAEGGTHLTGFKTVFTTVMNSVCPGTGNPQRKRCEFYRCRCTKWNDSSHLHQTSGSEI